MVSSLPDGGRVVKRFDIEQVTRIQIGEADVGLTWASVLFQGWFGYDAVLPRSDITIRARTPWDAQAGDHSLPTILVWGENNWRTANDALGAAIPHAAQHNP
ncbi:hypothetical protein SAMN05216199_3938 [Pedococcus cremeus]|uniref:Uncharacterized protein n=1 Tax=Pedococcus cremeus TaxID=587636 RepID=A0A1H9XJE4_9MICO|nr:hypothetical protein [Pedococcus cremeus]SES46320.1 hypothetical protein SAMN05216199_3938 [Pedococcus cremeus]